MEGAFTGQYLRVNLTQGTTAVEHFSEVDYRMFMGGTAMASAILMKELKPGARSAGSGISRSSPSSTSSVRSMCWTPSPSAERSPLPWSASSRAC